MPRKTKAKRKPHAVETRGRPTSLTPEVQAEIEQILKEGNTQRTACGYVGICEDTYYNWLQLAEIAREKPEKERGKYDDIYIQFSDTVKKARHFARRRFNGIISKAADKTWPAAAWWLERNYPEEYGQRSRVDMNENRNVNHNINIKHDVKEELSNANAGTVLDIMAECGAIPPPARGIEREAEVE